MTIEAPTITDTDLAEMERCAKEATPGPWKVGLCQTGEPCWCRTVLDTTPDGCVAPDGSVSAVDARYIASCSPDRILALLARLRAVEAEREVYRESLLFLRDGYHRFGGRACPACLYEEGRFVRSCRLHELLDEAEAERDRLLAQVKP